MAIHSNTTLIVYTPKIFIASLVPMIAMHGLCMSGIKITNCYFPNYHYQESEWTVFVAITQ